MTTEEEIDALKEELKRVIQKAENDYAKLEGVNKGLRSKIEVLRAENKELKEKLEEYRAMSELFKDVGLE